MQKVLSELRALAFEENPEDDVEAEEPVAAPPTAFVQEASPPKRKQYRLNREQEAIVEALNRGMRAEEDILRFCRDRLGYGRLGSRIKERILLAAGNLARQGLIVIEDGEFFLTPDGRRADIRVVAPPPSVRRSTPRGRRRAPRRRF